MAIADSLDQLIASKFWSGLMVASDSIRIHSIYGEDLEFDGIREHSEEELRSWLEHRGIPQLMDGSYWREFSDVAIAGAVEPSATPPGMMEPVPAYFKITVSRQSPQSLLGSPRSSSNRSLPNPTDVN